VTFLARSSTFWAFANSILSSELTNQDGGRDNGGEGGGGEWEWEWEWDRVEGGCGVRAGRVATT
jgi:hypothetical protein